MDPYAPPAARLEAPLPPLGTGERQAWSLEDALAAGWRGLKTSWAVLVFGYFVATLPGIVLSQAQSFVAGPPVWDDPKWWGIVVGFSFGGQLLDCLFAGGLAKNWIDVARGRTPSFADLFGGFRHFPAFFAFMLIETVVVIVAAPVFFVPYVVFKCGTALVRFYVAEESMPLLDAIRASWKATQGEKLRLFGFGIVAGLVGASGFLACCLGFYATVPIAAVALAWIHTRIGRPA
jgi:hypothetical protein